MSVSDNPSPSNPSLSPALLGFIILICFFGLLPNSYAANYMRNNFDLSKMVYKTLLRCCLINVLGFIVLLITALFLLNSTSKNEFICVMFQTSLTSPIFIVQSSTLQISILRCIISCSKKNEAELNSFQKTVVAFMTPLPFAYLGTLSIFRLANDKSLGMGHSVSTVHCVLQLDNDVLIDQISTHYLFTIMNHQRISTF